VAPALRPGAPGAAGRPRTSGQARRLPASGAGACCSVWADRPRRGSCRSRNPEHGAVSGTKRRLHRSRRPRPPRGPSRPHGCAMTTKPDLRVIARWRRATKEEPARPDPACAASAEAAPGSRGPVGAPVRDPRVGRRTPIEWLWEGIAGARAPRPRSRAPSYSGKTNARFSSWRSPQRTRPASPGGGFSGRARSRPSARASTWLHRGGGETGARSCAGEARRVLRDVLGTPRRGDGLDRVILFARTRPSARDRALGRSCTTVGREQVIRPVPTRLGAPPHLQGPSRTREEDQAAVAPFESSNLNHVVGAPPVLVISHTRKAGAESLEDVSGSRPSAPPLPNVVPDRHQREGRRPRSSPAR